MKLTELEPTFLKILSDQTYRMIDDVGLADGIEFLCPVCFKKNGGKVGTHAIICWRPHVPQSVPPTPGRWEFQGSGYNNLTLFAGSSSILLTSAECKAHFHITNGEIV